MLEYVSLRGPELSLDLLVAREILKMVCSKMIDL